MNRYFFVFYFFSLVSAYGTNVVNPNQYKQISEEEMENTFGALPSTIDSLDSLISYAAHYGHETYKSMVSENEENHGQMIFDTSKMPNGRYTKDKDFINDSSYSRVSEIINGVSKKVPMLFESPYSYSCFYFSRNNPIKVAEFNNYFDRFLVKNNEDLFRDYKKIIFGLMNGVGKLQKDALIFNEQVSNLSPHEIGSLFNVKQFSKKEKSNLAGKINEIYRDIVRVYNSADFISKNIDDIQLLEMYLFAEQVFDNLMVVEHMAKYIIESGYFYPESKNEHIKHEITQIDGASILSFTREKVDPRKDMVNFFHHRQFPMRNLYLMSRAVAFSLRDFANNFRAKAGLSPIPDEIFLQSDMVKNALEIDETLPSIEEFFHKQAETEKKSWLSDALMPAAKKAAKKKPTATHRSPIDPGKTIIRTPLPPRHIKKKISPSKAVTEIVISPPPKPSIGEKVFLLLPEQEKYFLAQLFSLKENSLSHDDANELTMGIYRALIDLNKAERAAEFLKRSSDSRIFTKGKTEKFLSRESMEYRLLPYLMQDLIPPNFEKEVLMNNSSFLRERVVAKKLKLYRDEIDLNSLDEVSDFLYEAEKVAAAVEPEKRRLLLVNLAHTWHKLSTRLENKRAFPNQDVLLASHREKIVSLLGDALPLIETQKGNVTVLEAYLFTYYLDLELEPEYERLTPNQIQAIQKRARKNLLDHTKAKVKTIHKVSPSGKKLDEYKVEHSIFHTITNDELGDYIIVAFDRPIKDKKIPLFVSYNDEIYRTDVFGGSRLKPNLKKGDYGSLIAVSLQAADFFKSWFTSDESFWYGQRAFMPAQPDKKIKASRGELKIATIPDAEELAVFGDIMVQDGFGFIKESKAENLYPVDRPLYARQKNVAYQALQAYDGDREAALELLENAKNAISSEDFDCRSVDERANSLISTLPKMTAIGIPVKGDKILLPNTPQWNEFVSEGCLVGRNPYSAKRIQVIDSDHINFSDDLLKLKVFQYTFTGYVNGKKGRLNGTFFKGIVMVIPDEFWPKIYEHIDMLVSSKDQKLNQSWINENIKIEHQNLLQELKVTGMLVVKNEYNNSHLAGIPVSLADDLAGDWDGDPYDIMSRKGFDHLAMIIKEEGQDAIPSHKVGKSFTKREKAGNFKKILDLRKPISSVWNGVVNRYYHLPSSQKTELVKEMAQSHMLGFWLGNHWEDKLGIDREPNDWDIVTAEMQLGVKCGEDAYKTSVDIESVLLRASEYEKVLDHLKSNRLIPYGNGLKKKLKEGNLKKALRQALEPSHSGNVVDKTFRGVARYLTEDPAYESYVSDDEED